MTMSAGRENIGNRCAYGMSLCVFFVTFRDHCEPLLHMQANNQQEEKLTSSTVPLYATGDQVSFFHFAPGACLCVYVHGQSI